VQSRKFFVSYSDKPCAAPGRLTDRWRRSNEVIGAMLSVEEIGAMLSIAGTSFAGAAVCSALLYLLF